MRQQGRAALVIDGFAAAIGEHRDSNCRGSPFGHEGRREVQPRRLAAHDVNPAPELTTHQDRTAHALNVRSVQHSRMSLPRFAVEGLVVDRLAYRDTMRRIFHHHRAFRQRSQLLHDGDVVTSIEQ